MHAAPGCINGAEISPRPTPRLSFLSHDARRQHRSRSTPHAPRPGACRGGAQGGARRTPHRRGRRPALRHGGHPRGVPPGGHGAPAPARQPGVLQHQPAPQLLEHLRAQLQVLRVPPQEGPGRRVRARPGGHPRRGTQGARERRHRDAHRGRAASVASVQLLHRHAARHPRGGARHPHQGVHRGGDRPPAAHLQARRRGLRGREGRAEGPDRGGPRQPAGRRCGGVRRPRARRGVQGQDPQRPVAGRASRGARAGHQLERHHAVRAHRGAQRAPPPHGAPAHAAGPHACRVGEGAGHSRGRGRRGGAHRARRAVSARAPADAGFARAHHRLLPDDHPAAILPERQRARVPARADGPREPAHAGRGAPDARQLPAREGVLDHADAADGAARAAGRRG